MPHTIAFAVLWFLAGFFAALLLGQFINLPFNAVQCGLMSLLVGLVAFMLKLQSEQGRRMFYEGPEPGEDGDVVLGCLWVIPLQILLFTLLGWSIWILLQ